MPLAVVRPRTSFGAAHLGEAGLGLFWVGFPNYNQVTRETRNALNQCCSLVFMSYDFYKDGDFFNQGFLISKTIL